MKWGDGKEIYQPAKELVRDKQFAFHRKKVLRHWLLKQFWVTTFCWDLNKIKTKLCEEYQYHHHTV